LTTDSGKLTLTYRWSYVRTQGQTFQPVKIKPRKTYVFNQPKRVVYTNNKRYHQRSCFAKL